MAQQETFFKREIQGVSVEVLKTYDRALAREAFESMDEPAHKDLFEALDVASNCDPADVPAPGSDEFLDFLWGEIEDSAREDGNMKSFFIVTETGTGDPVFLYVSPDWPSAEKFATRRLAATLRPV